MADLPISLLPKATTGYSDSLMVIVNYNTVASGQTESIPFSAVTQNGTSGTSGISGNDGTSGTSGINGTSGNSGTDGISGTSGTDGTSGTSGNNGTNGTSGTSGNNGTSGTSGIAGIAGGQHLFFNSQVNQSPYREISYLSDNLAQTAVTTSVLSLTTGVIAEYQTPSGYPGASIPPGIWSFYLHGYKQNNNASFRFYCDVYKRDTGGTETLLFSSDPVNVTTISPNIDMYVSDIYQSGSTLDDTDRIVVKVMGQNYGSLATAHTLTFVTEGTSHNSYVSTTLNYLAGTSGTSGTSGTDGTSGTSGNDGTSGTSGNDGTSGTSGNNGTSGSSGTSAPPAPFPTVYGLFSQTGNSVVVSATTVESSVINGGVGTLTVGANQFQIGDSFRADFGGLLSSRNGDDIRIRVKSGSVVLADSGLQNMNGAVNDVWQFSINFTIRKTGVAGVAEIVSLGVFHTTKQSNAAPEGFAFNTVNNTTFDTTVSNTLDVTVQFSTNSALNSIYSDIFVLNKIY